MDSPNVIISRVMPAAHADLDRLDRLVTKLISEALPTFPASNPGLKTESPPVVNEDKTKSLEKWMGFG